MADITTLPQNSPEFAEWLLDNFKIDLAMDQVTKIVITIDYSDIPIMEVTRMVLDKEQITTLPLQLKDKK